MCKFFNIYFLHFFWTSTFNFKMLHLCDGFQNYFLWKHFIILFQKADVDKQLANVRNLELESERSRLEEVLEELAALQATASAASEQNQVQHVRYFVNTFWDDLNFGSNIMRFVSYNCFHFYFFTLLFSCSKLVPQILSASVWFYFIHIFVYIAM